ncbi:peptidoglycan recognition protein 6 [Neosynchiropus ocellatus]
MLEERVPFMSAPQAALELCLLAQLFLPPPGTSPPAWTGPSTLHTKPVKHVTPHRYFLIVLTVNQSAQEPVDTVDFASTKPTRRPNKMDGGPRMRTLLLLALFFSMRTEASISSHMDDFIRAVQWLEDRVQGSEPVTVLQALRRAADLDDVFIQHFLGASKSDGSEMVSGVSRYLKGVLHHQVTEDSREGGVVLTSDGTTVALRPVVSGLEAGLSTGNVSHVHQLTLAGDLGLAIEDEDEPDLLGSDGCWDDLDRPRVFTLTDDDPALTTALINGGMDGFILGLAVSNRRPLKLSDLLKSYYCHQLDADGLDAAPLLISRRRRENYRTLAPPPVVVREAAKAVELQRKLEGHADMEPKQKRRLLFSVEAGVKELVFKFVDCPPMMTRCMWGARPYKGTPTNLTLPLPYLYIHHTFSPNKPCLSFKQCSADMRSIQRYHQDQRGWADIGYSFVAGSDGYIYEGRGWFWKGAHTRLHNSVGYGVAFIGNYTDVLPTQNAMGLVRDKLAACATGSRRLAGNFTLQGHRQVVDTDCPGDALFNEIKGWEHFGW